MDATQDFKSTTVAVPIATGGIPDQIGPYKILKLLGRGGMGAVYEAEDVNTKRHVAVKILSGGTGQTPETIERFKREGQLAASVSHSRSTFVYSAGQQEDVLYIVMELMPGGTLKDEISRDGPLPIDRAVDAMIDVIDGLGVAHRAGIIHRDIKPSNCFVEEDGRVKIGDFGLSKSFMGDTSLTRTGSFMGTPQFAATEQIKGGQIDERTDIYAIGCTLFYALTGKAPFEGDFAKVIAGIAAESAPNAKQFRPGIPNALAKLVSQTLEKDPNKRPQTLHELRDGLLPFATQGSSFADVGRRVAAFFIDGSYVALLVSLFVFPSLLLVYYFQTMTPDWDGDFSRPFYFIETILISQAIVTILYFVVSEGIWGRSVGKMVMGLRVTNLQGERPGLIRSFGRAIILPGITAIITGLFPLLVFNWSDTLGDRMMASADPNGANRLSQVELSLQTQVITFVGWVTTGLLVLSIRKRNGFRGIHEFVSGTRVQRDIVQRNVQSTAIPFWGAKTDIDREKIGDYRLVAQLGSNNNRVYLAHDERLDRNVWISECDSKSTEEIVSASIGRARPTQQRWLDEYEGNDQRWSVWEAIRGGPFSRLLRQRTTKWPDTCHFLSEVVSELAAATDDKSLPDPLDYDNLWIDDNNQVKLIQPALRAAATDVNATELLCAVCRQVSKFDDVPLSFLNFVEELEKKPDSFETLTWAESNIRSFEKNAANWKWDDRLGAIAISAGLEQTVFQSISIALAFLLPFVFSGGFLSYFQTILVALGAIVFAIGYFFKGGFVFRVLGVEIVQIRRNQVAGRLQAALRHIVAWSPFIVAHSLVATTISLSVSGAYERLSRSASELAVIAGGLSTLPFLVFYIGALVSIISPSRGLQDWLCRTRLMRKK